MEHLDRTIHAIHGRFVNIIMNRCAKATAMRTPRDSANRYTFRISDVVEWSFLLAALGRCVCSSTSVFCSSSSARRRPAIQSLVSLGRAEGALLCTLERCVASHEKATPRAVPSATWTQGTASQYRRGPRRCVRRFVRRTSHTNNDTCSKHAASNLSNRQLRCQGAAP